MNTLAYNKIGDNGISLPPIRKGYIYVHFSANSEGVTIPKTIITDINGNPIEDINNHIRISKKASKYISHFNELTENSISTEFTLAIPTSYSQRIGIDLTKITGYDTHIESIIGSFSENVYKCKFSNVTIINDAGNHTSKNVSLKIFDVKDTKNLSDCKYMFTDCNLLTYVSELDMSNVNSMWYMFKGCTSLKNIAGLIDTSNVTNMTSAFQGCKSLLEIPDLDTSNVTSMTYMFLECTSLKTIPLLNTSNVTSMKGMFRGCTSLETIPQISTHSVTTLRGMFYDCISLKQALIESGNATDLVYMFKNCSLLERKIKLSSNNINTTDMYKGTPFEGEEGT